MAKLAGASDPTDAQAAANSWFLLEAAHCEDREAVALAMQRITAALASEAQRLRELDQP